MVTITGTYKGELRCISKHGPSGVELITDAPTDNHGKGSSFSPTDLVATALATCMLTTIAIWAQRHEVALNDASYTVTKEMATTSPRRIARLAVTIRIAGITDPHHRERMEYVARACPVHQSLHPEVQMPVTFEWA